MKSNRDIRTEAKALVKGGWFFRIVVVTCVLQGIGNLAGGLLSRLHARMDIVSFEEFVRQKATHLRQGLDYALPSRAAYGQMLGAGTLELFIAYIFGAIAMFGIAAVLLKALRRDSDRWFADSFGGFSRPLGVAGLLFLMNLRVALWSLLFVIPGLVAVYRYRLAWYVKAEHPDYGAGQCLAESSERMKGHKSQAFFLDCAYVLRLMAAGLLLGAGLVSALVTNGLVAALLSALCFSGALILLLWTMVLWSAARTVFYREVRDA